MVVLRREITKSTLINVWANYSSACSAHLSYWTVTLDKCSICASTEGCGARVPEKGTGPWSCGLLLVTLSLLMVRCLGIKLFSVKCICFPFFSFTKTFLFRGWGTITQFMSPWRDWLPSTGVEGSESPQVLEAVFREFNQTLKLGRLGFEFQFCSLLYVCLWACGLTCLNLSFIFWAMGSIICTQRVVLKSKCTSDVPKTQWCP